MEKTLNYMRSVNLAEDARTVLNYSPVYAGALNDLLRKQLAAANSNRDHHAVTRNPAEAAVSVISEILRPGPPDRRELHANLVRLYELQTEIYLRAEIPRALRKRQHVSRHGLVISPDNCLTSILDVYRVRAFIRSIDQALLQLRRDRQRRPIHIVYPACGPYAPLLLPLVSHYSECMLYDPQDLQVTLIDMQQGAVLSLQSLVEAFAIQEYVREIRCQDAMEYQAEEPIDMVVLEAMQHGFSKEGHLPLARHFIEMLAEDGIFLPQEVSIRCVLNTGQREFIDQWRETEQAESMSMNADVVAERIELGEILSVTPQSLKTMHIQRIDNNTALLECGSVTIPSDLKNPAKQLLLLCSQVRVFGDEYIGEYDSGITNPLPDEQVCIDFIAKQQQPGDLLVRRGDSLQFYYRLNGLPGFFAVAKFD